MIYILPLLTTSIPRSVPVESGCRINVSVSAVRLWF